jgi:hypothetical protein
MLQNSNESNSNDNINATVIKKFIVITRLRLHVNLGAGMAETGSSGTRLERSLSLLGVSGEPLGNLEVQAGTSVAVKDSRCARCRSMTSRPWSMGWTS